MEKLIHTSLVALMVIITHGELSVPGRVQLAAQDKLLAPGNQVDLTNGAKVSNFVLTAYSNVHTGLREEEQKKLKKTTSHTQCICILFVSSRVHRRNLFHFLSQWFRIQRSTRTFW